MTLKLKSSVIQTNERIGFHLHGDIGIKENHRMSNNVIRLCPLTHFGKQSLSCN